MQSDTSRLRTNALHILTIATVVVGFGFFETSFQHEIDVLLARFIHGEGGLQAILSFLKVYVGIFIIFTFFVIFMGVRRLLVHDNPSGQDLVRVPFDALGLLILQVFGLFSIQQLLAVKGLQ